MALILVRHTRPAGGEGRCYGRTDLTLPELALAARPILARVAGVDRIVSSPLRRCRLLARVLAARLGVPVRVDPDWREIDFGRWEGVPWDAIPRAEIDAWAADLLNARPHAGESVAMLLARTRRALRRSSAPPGRTLVVTHGGTIRAALFAAGAGEAAWRRAIGFGEVVALPARGRRSNGLPNRAGARH